jgi:hypothetical protein
VPDELQIRWHGVEGESVEQFSIRWENSGYVAEGMVTGVDVHYVVRLGPDFRTRQVMVFRDLDDPDLWLATDGNGRWGEVNGSVRHELHGCYDIDLGCTPFTNTIPILTLGLEVGESATRDFAWIDVDTLAVEVSTQTYTRVSERQWRFEAPAWDYAAEIEVDIDGFVVDYPGLYRRGEG